MDRRTTIRASFALALSLVAVISVAVAPVAAFKETSSTGTTGYYTVYDDTSMPGITCKYENAPGTQNDELDKIVIRQLFSHGPYAQSSLVGRRYIILRNQPPHGDNDYDVYYRSPWVKKSANDQYVAFFGPSTFVVPEGTRARWRVREVLRFYAVGSSTNVVGEVKGLYEVYDHKLIGTAQSFIIGSNGAPGYCRRDYA